MRKVAFIDFEEIKKIMLYNADGEETYLFYFDTWHDAPSTKDFLYPSVEEVEEYCLIEYNVKPSDWINISDPQNGCQHDFIAPTKVKGRDTGNPQWGNFERLINGKFIEISSSYKEYSINGTTGNERLFLSGLMDEFDNAKGTNDFLKARKILSALQIDELSINRIIKK